MIHGPRIHKEQTLTTKDCKGPQTNMPKNVVCMKTWSAKIKILVAEFNMSTVHFCWSGLYRSYVLWHIRLRSFAVLVVDVCTFYRYVWKWQISLPFHIPQLEWNPFPYSIDLNPKKVSVGASPAVQPLWEATPPGNMVGKGTGNNSGKGRITAFHNIPSVTDNALTRSHGESWYWCGSQTQSFSSLRNRSIDSFVLKELVTKQT